MLFILCYVISPSLAQWGATALLSAAFGGSVLVGKMLLEEFGSSIDEEAYVSVCTPQSMCICSDIQCWHWIYSSGYSIIHFKHS